MAPNSKETGSPTLGQEIVAVVLLFLAVFLLISLSSYSLPAETTLFPVNTKNWGGAIGYFTARLLTGILGITSFWLVLLFFFFSGQYFRRRKALNRLPLIAAGSTGIVLSLSSLTSVVLPGQLTVFGATYPGGGSLGSTLFSLLSPFLGRPGFFLVFLLLLLVSLMGAVEFSLYNFMLHSRQLCGVLWQRLTSSAKPQEGTIRREPRVLKESPEEKRDGGLPAVEPKVHAPVTIDPGDDHDFQPLPVSEGEFALPSISLLDKPDEKNTAQVEVDREQYIAISKRLEEKFKDFGVDGKVIGISPGPVITTYEFAPAPGVKISRIVALENDLALGLKTESVRIAGSIPGKAALGIEIPNRDRQMVYIREILGNEHFQKKISPLAIGLGKDVVGNPVYADLSEMPHLLIAGTTGSGKSVGINSIICSILLKASPDEVRLLMVDPKRIELSHYEAIPHLLHPVVVDPKMASRALQWAVLEMERRYGLMEEMRVKNLAGYNKVADEKLPLIVIIIDELADLMMVASKDVEGSVARLAQMARAAGMHLILATQRPSVDVLTGLIKANFPTRMSFKVSSKIDSRTILDASGAEHLLGKGDMLFMAPGTRRLQRIHAAYISEPEIDRIVSFLKDQRAATYDESVLKIAEEPEANGGADEVADYDEKYDEAVEFVCESGQASISMVQRRLRVGYNRAARMIELMEKEGIVGPADGAKAREVLARPNY